MMIQISVKSAHATKKIISIKKLTKGKVESLVKSNFDLNQICKTVLTQRHSFWNINTTGLLYIFIEDER